MTGDMTMRTDFACLMPDSVRGTRRADARGEPRMHYAITQYNHRIQIIQYNHHDWDTWCYISDSGQVIGHAGKPVYGTELEYAKIIRDFTTYVKTLCGAISFFSFVHSCDESYIVTSAQFGSAPGYVSNVYLMPGHPVRITFATLRR